MSTQIENMEHKDEPDSDITITKVTSLEELPCEEVAEISQNVVTGKALVSYLALCHVGDLGSFLQIVIVHRLVSLFS